MEEVQKTVDRRGLKVISFYFFLLPQWVYWRPACCHFFTTSQNVKRNYVRTMIINLISPLIYVACVGKSLRGSDKEDGQVETHRENRTRMDLSDSRRGRGSMQLHASLLQTKARV